MDFKDEFFKLVEQANSLIITSHTSPDDDSIGSTLALYQIVRQKYPSKKLRVVYTGERMDRYNYFSDYKAVEFVPDLANSLGDMDLLIVLDGGGFGRFSKDPEKLKAAAKTTICIDHHSSPPDTFLLSMIDTQATSTSELIYRLFSSNLNLTKSIAETLLLGILGDTGSFNYIKPNQIEIFDISKQLIQIVGVELQDFRSRFDTISPRIYTLIGKIMTVAKFEETPNWPPFMYSYLEREALSEQKFTDNEIHDASHLFMSNYLRTITGYPWGFVITPKSDGSCGLSLRSLPGSVNVRSIVERMKIGGGHDRVAGGTFKSKAIETVQPKACVNELLAWMKLNEPILS